MKEKSSLSKGDIESVISNFIEAVRSALFSGHTVSIRHFGSFSLSAKAEGTNTEEKLEFVDLVSYLKGLSLNGLSISLDGSGNDSGNEDEENYVDPDA